MTLRRGWCVIIAWCLYPVTAVTAAAAEPAGNEWRAPPEVLVRRLERLAAGEELGAAEEVFKRIVASKRAKELGLVDRARMALARGYLRAKRTKPALAHVTKVPWADKSSRLAAEIVSLELAIRWQALLDENLYPVTGAVPAINAPDSDAGEPGGRWAERWENYRQLSRLLEQGAGMVRAEGGRVRLPAPPAMLDLAHYGHGALSWKELRIRLGPPAGWDPSLAAALCLLHLSECEVERAGEAGAVLFERFPQSPQARLVFRRLRTWQLRRELLRGRLRLWDYPVLEKRLDALSKRYAAIDKEVRQRLRRAHDLTRLNMKTSLTRLLSPREKDEVELPPEDEPASLILDKSSTEERNYRLVLDYDDLQVTVDNDPVPVGEKVEITLYSIHPGKHVLRLYRIADRETWRKLCKAPKRGLLPAKPVREKRLDYRNWPLDGIEDGDLGFMTTETTTFDGLPRGYYVLTVRARACPVVLMQGFVVMRHDLYALAARDRVLAWVVDRGNGLAAGGVRLRAHVEELPDARAAGGEEYHERGSFWQAGFRYGLTGKEEEIFIPPGRAEEYALGVKAGRRHAREHPPVRLELEAVSDARGVARLSLPPGLHGKNYRCRIGIAGRGPVARVEVRYEEYVYRRDKVVAWADKPFARPGEKVRFKALLREFDGEEFYLVRGRVPVEVLLEHSPLWSGEMEIDEFGSLAGEVTIPPGSVSGTLWLRIDHGRRCFLARIRPLSLPRVQSEVLGEFEHVQAGEKVSAGLRLLDRAGEPLAGVKVACRVMVFRRDKLLPTDQPRPVSTDLSGAARFRIPTLDDEEALYRVRFSYKHEGEDYCQEISWRTRVFPFPLSVRVRRREVRVGDFLQVECRLPAGACVRLQVCRQDRRLGRAVPVRGKGKEWVATAIPVVPGMVQADRLLVFAGTAAGRKARRWLSIKVLAAATGEEDKICRLVLPRAEARPDRDFSVILATSRPGRDMLLVGGTRKLLFADGYRLDKTTRDLRLRPNPAWAPNLFLQGVMYEPGSGFRTTRRQEVKLLPVDRLLRVRITTDRTRYGPGDTVKATVEVRDWRGRPRPGCAISLGVVNRLVYQLHKDPTPDLWEYFHRYSRAWNLREASPLAIPRPKAKLWRSVFWRWVGGPAEEGHRGRRTCARFGGGCRRGYSRGCGVHRRQSLPLINRGRDPTIFWVADLRTDEQGRARVSFVLPAAAAVFRCTARVNDKSAAVMVGEVRTELRARTAYACSLRVPACVRPGDRFFATATIYNYAARATAFLAHLPNGETRAVTVPGHGRRQVFCELTATKPEGEPVAVNGLIGRGKQFVLRVRRQGEEDGREAVSRAGIFVPEPGVPLNFHLRLAADGRGLARVPQVKAGDAVYLRLRAWPDGAARLRHLLAGWKESKDNTLQCIAWLSAAPGARQRRRLAAAWQSLGHTPAAWLVRLYAAEKRLSDLDASGEPSRVPGNMLGCWIRARARRLGLGLPRPGWRGFTGRDLFHEVLGAAVALCEGWPEAGSAWERVKPRLLRLAGGDDASQARLVAVAADTARLAGDRETRELLLARLSRLPWPDTLTKVLAWLLLKDRTPAPPARVELLGARGGPVLPAKEFSQWCGFADEPLVLRTRPGSLLALDLLVVRRARPETRPGNLPGLEIWQCVDPEKNRFARIDPDRPLWPSRRHLLVIDNRERKQEFELLLQLAGAWRWDRENKQAALVEGYKHYYTLTREQEELIDSMRRKNTRALARERISALFRSMLYTSWPVTELVNTSKELRELLENSDRDPAVVSLTVPARSRLVLPVIAAARGSFRQPGPAIYDEKRKQWVRVRGCRLVIRPGSPEKPAPTPPSRRIAARLAKLLPRLTPPELAYVAKWTCRTAEEWEAVFRLLDPGVRHELDELTSHPCVGTPGHWTTKELRRWIDGEPLLRAGVGKILDVLEKNDYDADDYDYDEDDEDADDEDEEEDDDDGSLRDAYRRDGPLGMPRLKLHHLIALRLYSFRERREAWKHLPQPAPAPRRRPANLHAWYMRLAALGLCKRGDYYRWIWEQRLSLKTLRHFGYPASLAGWRDFLARELDIRIRIGPGLMLRMRRVEEARAAKRKQWDKAATGLRKTIPETTGREYLRGKSRLGTGRFTRNNLMLTGSPRLATLRMIDPRLPLGVSPDDDEDDDDDEEDDGDNDDYNAVEW